MNVVLDSSVVAKWYFYEEQTEEAVKLRNLHIINQIQIAAPILLLFELGNIFVSRGLNKGDFAKNFQTLLNFEINFVEVDLSLFQSIFAIAGKYNITFYDATYLATAKKLKCQLITTDKKLYNATKKLKFVKLLSKYFTH